MCRGPMSHELKIIELDTSRPIIFNPWLDQFICGVIFGWNGSCGYRALGQSLEEKEKKKRHHKDSMLAEKSCLVNAHKITMFGEKRTLS